MVSKIFLAILIAMFSSSTVLAQQEVTEDMAVMDATVQDEAVEITPEEWNDDDVMADFEDNLEDELEDDLDDDLAYDEDEGDFSQPQEGNVTLDFRDADIRNVLRILAYKSGINIVPGPAVTGLVTIQLTDVPWQLALDVILENYGYSYEKKGNIIMVTTIENLMQRRENAQALAEQEPLETKHFVLNFAKASKVAESINKLKTSRGTVHYDQRTNTIIVRDTVSNIPLITDIVSSLDATTPQVLIESKIIETTLSKSEKLGVDWIAKAEISGSKRPTVYPFTPSSENKYLVDDIPATTTGFSYGTLDFSTTSIVLEMLKSRTDTNILSNPRIVVLNNQTAKISVGSQYPLPTYTYNEEQARLQVSGWEYMDIGVIFSVTPQVNNAGFITLDIEPRITDILDFVEVEGTSLPRLSNESVSTKVMIKDGDTLVIAGLIKDKVIELKKKLPILGDIPILGLIFTKTEKTISKTDLIIFLTPHIITPEIFSN